MKASEYFTDYRIFRHGLVGEKCCLKHPFRKLKVNFALCLFAGTLRIHISTFRTKTCMHLYQCVPDLFEKNKFGEDIVKKELERRSKGW